MTAAKATTTSALTRSLTIPLTLITCAAAFALYATMAVFQWRGFVAPSWDLGIFTQLAKQYSQFHAPIVNIKGDGYNLLGDHFHPILVLLGPIYALFPSGIALLITQAVLFAASAWPITRLAFERLGLTGATMTGVAYIGSWGLINAAFSQFHEIAFAVPLLAFGLVWWLRGNHLLATIAISLLVFVKEDMGLTVFMFGVAIFIMNRSHWAWATWAAGWGILWFVLTVQVILPALNVQGRYDYSDNLTVTQSLFQSFDTKLAVVGALILAAGVIGIRSPFMLMLLPTLAWRFAGDVQTYWGFLYHYSATLIPIATVAMLHVVPRRFIKLAPAVALITTVALLTNSQINLLWKRDQYASPDATAAIAAASRYPTVATDIFLLAYMVPTTNTYFYGTIGSVVPDAVILNVTKAQQSPAAWAQATYGGQWTTVYSDSTYQVAARG